LRNFDLYYNKINFLFCRASSVVTSEHPVVGEYLKAYEGVIHFRNTLSKLMLDRGKLVFIKKDP